LVCNASFAKLIGYGFGDHQNNLRRSTSQTSCTQQFRAGLSATYHSGKNVREGSSKLKHDDDYGNSDAHDTTVYRKRVSASMQCNSLD
jgi:hypothetical protein